MSKKIELWIKEGKNDGEIASLLLQDESSKGLDAQAIASLIAEAKKTEEVLSHLKASEEAAIAQKAIADKARAEDEKINKLVDDKLKSIGVSLTKYKTETDLKRFNPRTGKIEEVKVSDEYAETNNMLKAFAIQDFSSAKSISNQIDIANDIKEARLQGLIKATPTVSDVTTRGGYAIPTEVSDMINQLIYESSVCVPLCNQDNVIYQSKVYPLMYGISVSDIADQSTAVTEKNPTLSNPTVTMQRMGGYSTISNTIINQKGADLVNAFVAAYSSAIAEYLDLRIACGNVTGNSDLTDGIVFDTNTYLPSPLVLSNLKIGDLKTIKNTLSAKANLAKCAWMASREVSDAIGLLENTAGNYIFPNYVTGGKAAPLGIPLITNAQIPATLDVGGDNRTSGTDNVLILADFSKVILGLSQDTRIDTSSHFFFTSDLLTMRVIKHWGQKVISSTSTGGIVAIAQELN